MRIARVGGAVLESSCALTPITRGNFDCAPFGDVSFIPGAGGDIEYVRMMGTAIDLIGHRVDAR